MRSNEDGIVKQSRQLSRAIQQEPQPVEHITSQDSLLAQFITYHVDAGESQFTDL